ncbi:MAG: esterase family protein, partial [Clostridia bacterium]|nr:esterase family protein [Clostridia bacterium]
HGLSDDNTAWTRRTSIERYAQEYGLAVVMPNANRSFYADMKIGLDYYTYVSKEVPFLAQTYFPISSRREDSFIAGLSMGGYGAFMIALRNPEKFSAAASLSGALELDHVFDLSAIIAPRQVKALFDSKEEYRASDYHLPNLLKKHAAEGTRLPRFFQCCGTEDMLYPINREFMASAKAYGIDLTYEEGPGDHDWSYWDANIQRVLAWIFN